MYYIVKLHEGKTTSRMASFYAALPAVLVLTYYCQFFTQITSSGSRLYTSACKIVTLVGVLTGNQSSYKKNNYWKFLKKFCIFERIWHPPNHTMQLCSKLPWYINHAPIVNINQSQTKMSLHKQVLTSFTSTLSLQKCVNTISLYNYIFTPS